MVHNRQERIVAKTQGFRTLIKLTLLVHQVGTDSS